MIFDSLQWCCHISCEIIYILICNSYEGFQHFNFILSQKHFKDYLMVKLTLGWGRLGEKIYIIYTHLGALFKEVELHGQPSKELFWTPF